ncbi:MAG: hypothetical protein FJ086_15435 [Deltaproteobacteria bacterium]|nr:hypothetical protein [Deltaproteobacteria bacterium]
MTTPISLARNAPPREPPALTPVRPEGEVPADLAGGQTTWLRPRYSLSAHRDGLAVKVEAASAPC